MVPIEKNICYQTMPTKPLIKMGEIPQAEVTYTYFHVGYPFMNEHQLMIGESTWGGREETFCDAGWMVIEQIQCDFTENLTFCPNIDIYINFSLKVLKRAKSRPLL